MLIDFQLPWSYSISKDGEQVKTGPFTLPLVSIPTAYPHCTAHSALESDGVDVRGTKLVAAVKPLLASHLSTLATKRGTREVRYRRRGKSASTSNLHVPLYFRDVGLHQTWGFTRRGASPDVGLQFI